MLVIIMQAISIPVIIILVMKTRGSEILVTITREIGTNLMEILDVSIPKTNH